MPHVSPIRVIRKTRLWLPLVVLMLALVLFGVGGAKAYRAYQFETHGVLAEATVTRKERRERRDSDGNLKITLFVSYSYLPLGGVGLVSRRVEVGSRFYNSVREGGSFTVRYLPDRPRTHEMGVGATRQSAEETAGLGLLALVGAGGLGLFFGGRAVPLMRALSRGQVRRAEVIAHVAKPSRRKDTGGRYGKVRWRDETGAEGESGWVPMLDVASHPVGCRITVLVDPRSGRTWWEEELADDTVGLFQRG